MKERVNMDHMKLSHMLDQPTPQLKRDFVEVGILRK
jgi:hypothetical protein